MSDKPIDYSSALERIGGDRELLEELLELYVQDFQEKYSLLQKAINQKDYNQIREVGHSLKGSSANLSLIPLNKASFIMETAGREKNIENAEKALALLDQEFKRLQNFLSEKNSNTSEENKKKTENKSSQGETLATTRENIKEGQVLAADDSVDNQLLLQAIARQNPFSSRRLFRSTFFYC